ncbi:zinc finger protein RFP-like [Liasis olivaceus]
MSEHNTIKRFCSEVICSICLEYFSDPVILECGHNFCHHCVLKYWKEFVTNNTCPQCKVATESKCLLINKPLEKFVRMLQQLNEEPGGKWVCEEHQEPWTCFCKNHQAAICMRCAESTEHEGHNIISLEEAAQELKDYFLEFLDYLNNQRSAILEHKTRAETESQNLFKLTEKIKKEIDSGFEELRNFLKSEEHFLMSKICETEKEIGEKRDERMNELFRELSAHDRLVRELQKKCDQQPNDLLQDVRSTLERCKMRETLQSFQPFSLKERWEIWDLWDASIFLEISSRRFQDTLKPGFPLQQAVITLDKETAHPQLNVSEDCKTLKLGNEVQNLPKTRKRFDASLSVLACEEFMEGRNYWDVSVENEGEWTVGVARKSVRRKDPIFIGPKAGIWAIGKRGNEYFALDPPNSVRMQHNGELKRIRVFFNYNGKHVTFFDADGAGMLHRAFIAATSKEIFVPFFHLSDTAVLTLTP